MHSLLKNSKKTSFKNDEPNKFSENYSAKLLLKIEPNFLEFFYCSVTRKVAGITSLAFPLEFLKTYPAKTQDIAEILFPN